MKVKNNQTTTCAGKGQWLDFDRFKKLERVFSANQTISIRVTYDTRNMFFVEKSATKKHNRLMSP